MKKGLLFLVLLFVSFVGLGQCPGVTITTQSEIDNFAANYPGCTEFEYITIEGYPESITNLNGLNQIEIINNDFNVNVTEITDFSGLENLGIIGGEFAVFYNDFLINFNGLTNLETIGGAFNSYYNINQIDFSGLNSLTLNSEYNRFQCVGNSSLQSFHGLENVDEISGSVFIVENNSLENLNGLENLVLIGGTFSIYDNENLLNLNGLEGLQAMESQLAITGNPNLQTLNGLENLQTMVVSLQYPFLIFENENLFSIDALNNLDFSLIERFEVFDNPNLSQCAINSICEAFQNGVTTLLFQNNKIGCNNTPEVEAQCNLAITDVELSQNLSVFPNPVSAILNIETSNTISFEKATIYSTLGKLILETSENQINLETLSAGIYFVEVVTDKGSLTKKIVKE